MTSTTKIEILGFSLFGVVLIVLLVRMECGLVRQLKDSDRRSQEQIRMVTEQIQDLRKNPNPSALSLKRKYVDSVSKKPLPANDQAFDIHDASISNDGNGQRSPDDLALMLAAYKKKKFEEFSNEEVDIDWAMAKEDEVYQRFRNWKYDGVFQRVEHPRFEILDLKCKSKTCYMPVKYLDVKIEDGMKDVEGLIAVAGNCGFSTVEYDSVKQVHEWFLDCNN